MLVLVSHGHCALLQMSTKGDCNSGCVAVIGNAALCQITVSTCFYWPNVVRAGEESGLVSADESNVVGS